MFTYMAHRLQIVARNVSRAAERTIHPSHHERILYKPEEDWICCNLRTISQHYSFVLPHFHEHAMTLKQITCQVTKKVTFGLLLLTIVFSAWSMTLLAQDMTVPLLDEADPTVATIIFCQSIITPPPTPAVPEPGSGLLLLTGLTLLILSAALLHWKRRGVKLLSLLLLALGLMASGFGVERLTAQSGSCGLTVEAQGAGEIQSRDLRCQNTCQVPGAPGEIRHFKAVPTAGSQFVAWRVNGEPYTGPVQMTGDTILTAIFEPVATPTPDLPAYRLTVTRIGSGGGLVYGEGIECGHDCEELYSTGRLVELHAYPDALSEFSHWLIDGESRHTGAVVMNANRTATAVFDLVPPTCLPSNGGIEQCGDQLDNDCNGKIDDGCYECRTDVQAFQCCRDDVCTTMNACAAGQAAVFLGCDNVACNPMVRCETAPQGGPCECEIVNDGLDNDCDGYIDEPTDTNCVN